MIPQLNAYRDALDSLCTTPTEKRLFALYWEHYFTPLGDRDPANELFEQGKFPALIPQVWVNWLHYNSGDSERAALLKKQPFRVDFALFTQERRLIIEVDGSTHFGAASGIDERGVIRLDADMQAFTEHLRRDRWLRRQGWEVYRFSNKEIEDLAEISDLLEEIGLEEQAPF